jgi:putative Mg2+ transporter-C (MgtC) family protein
MGEMVQQVIEIFRLDLMLQLGLATLLAGAIGLERELGGKPAGLRTNILICIGAVLYTHLSLAMLGATSGTGQIPPGTDTTRVAAQIVTGVGFIGAGTILHARGAVVGLTSAATIWVVAAIGVAIGCGYYLEGLGTTLAVLVVLSGLGRVETLVQRQSMRSTITIHAKPGPAVVEDLETLVRRTGLELISISNRQENVDLVIELELRGSKRLYDQAIVTLLHHNHVRTVSTGE